MITVLPLEDGLNVILYTEIIFIKDVMNLKAWRSAIFGLGYSSKFKSSMSNVVKKKNVQKNTI